MIFFLAAIAFLNPGIDLRSTFTYDNNVYDYSRADLDTFLSRTRPERFPIEAADDLAVSFMLNLWFRVRILGRRTTTIRLHAETVNHSVNHPKDGQTFGAALRQSFGRWALMIDYRYQPRIMLRFYPPPGGGEYLPCTYTLHRAAFTFTAELSHAVSMRLTGGREYETYRAEFAPYDSRIWRAGGSLILLPRPAIETAVGYDFKDSRAAGPMPDLSHDQHAATVTITVPFPRVRAATLRGEYRCACRLYTTDLTPDQDTPHAGRTDVIQRWEAGARFPVDKHLDLDPSFAYEYRRSSSDAYPDIGNKKNFDDIQFACGLRLHY